VTALAAPPVMETLWCQHGDGHAWQRPRVRGTKPTVCAEHRDAAYAAARAAKRPAAEKLWCEIGKHDWERPFPKKGGRRPRACDRCRQRREAPAVLAKPAPRPPEQQRAEHIARVRGDRRRVAASDEAVERRTRPFDPIYGHLADAVIYLRTGRGAECARALRRLAGVAELLSLDPVICGPVER
jgi:hypothetical protein